MGNLAWVFIGCALIGAGASAVGVFAYLRKQALVGDAVAHAILPGVVLSFMLGGSKDILVLLPGAVVAGWIGILSIELISKRSKIKPDTAIAIVLTVFFALGIVLLTHVQQVNYGNQSGLQDFLFGKAAAMLPSDLVVFIVVDVVLLITIWLMYPYLKLYSFDPDFARSIGVPVKLLQFVLATLTVLAVASGIQAVGVVLMAAMIITPAAAARFLSSRLSVMIMIAMVIGVGSSLAGAYISSLNLGMPTGPWIVIILSLLAVSAFIFAPQKGLLRRYLRRIEHSSKVKTENLLKVFYSAEEKSGITAMSLSDILASGRFLSHEIDSMIKRLNRKGLIRQFENKHSLTESGRKEASRIVRLHRLWELYLNERMNIAPDHVHHDAEAIEHIITPELERALLLELEYPTVDPHQSEIPGIKASPNEQ